MAPRNIQLHLIAPFMTELASSFMYQQDDSDGVGQLHFLLLAMPREALTDRRRGVLARNLDSSGDGSSRWTCPDRPASGLLPAAPTVLPAPRCTLPRLVLLPYIQTDTARPRPHA